MRSAGASEAPGRPVPFRHEALVYGSDDAFVAAVVPFVAKGVAAGEPTLLVTTPRNADLVREALEGDTAAVRFIDADAWYVHPASALEGYRRVLEEEARSGAGCIRVVGEVRFGQREWEQRAWIRYEAAVNRLLEGLPAWVLCPYDVRTLPPRVVDHAARTHPLVWRDSGSEPSAEYLAPEVLVPRLARPPEQAAGLGEVRVESDAELRRARRSLEALLAQTRLPERRRRDAVVAVHELMTNALRHGSGRAEVRVSDAGDSVVCEVRDEALDALAHLDGAPDVRSSEDAGAERSPVDPLAGYAPPPARDLGGGLGLWLARRLADAMEIDGTNARLVFASVRRAVSR